jgi:glycerol-3-phosphate dehydrogenase
LAEEQLDVLVVGGGIHGAWTARWAAASGLETGLVEAVDYASGTSSRSTMLAHGGLRYLAQYDFGLVREALTERAHLVAKAPHLVRPLTFLLPFYEGAPYPDWQLRLGVRLYSLLARGSGFPSHELLTKRQVLELEPGLREEGLTGGALYWDAQILSPERLTTWPTTPVPSTCAARIPSPVPASRTS